MRIAEQFGVTFELDEVERNIPQMYALYEQLYEQDDSFWSDDVRAKAIWIEMYEYMASLLEVPPGVRRELAQEIYRYYFSPEAWKPYDDVLPTLDTLRANGFRMALISNWDSTLAPIIEGLDMTQYFDTIISSAVVRLHKPMPEIFNLALDSLEVAPDEALHVGDHIYADAQGAASAGLTPILLDRDDRHKEYSGLRVKSLTQVNTLLKTA